MGIGFVGSGFAVAGCVAAGFVLPGCVAAGCAAPDFVPVEVASVDDVLFVACVCEEGTLAVVFPEPELAGAAGSSTTAATLAIGGSSEDGRELATGTSLVAVTSGEG
jgi:hypothetical protein